MTKRADTTAIQTMHAQWEAAYASFSADLSDHSKPFTAEEAFQESDALQLAILYQRPETARDALILAAHLDMIQEAGVSTGEASRQSKAFAAGMARVVAFLATADADAATRSGVLADIAEMREAQSAQPLTVSSQAA